MSIDFYSKFIFSSFFHYISEHQGRWFEIANTYEVKKKNEIILLKFSLKNIIQLRKNLIYFEK